MGIPHDRWTYLSVLRYVAERGVHWRYLRALRRRRRAKRR